ncbi:hypothetical protein SDC9_169982 [bioreactor metagenome]|uniref:Uncharacterized protein n=1 Tax=bioreactor metagenome TaxID=1076179 RepID=A0A645G9W9_9ZZZZ
MRVDQEVRGVQHGPLVAGTDIVDFGGAPFEELGIFQQAFAEQDHVPGGADRVALLLVRQPAGTDEVTAGHADLERFRIHLHNERILAVGDEEGDLDGGVVGALDCGCFHQV